MINQYLDEILNICAEEFGVSVENVLSKSRKEEYVYCRKSFCLIVKQKLDVKYETIALKLDKTIGLVHYYLKEEPENKYYDLCMTRIKKRLENEGN